MEDIDKKIIDSISLERIYAIEKEKFNLLFETKEQMNEFFKKSLILGENKKNIHQDSFSFVVYDYLGNYLDEQDVICKRYLTTSEIYFISVFDQNHIKILVNDNGKFCWEIQYGNISDIYEEFGKHGVVFDNNAYLEQIKLKKQ